MYIEGEDTPKLVAPEETSLGIKSGDLWFFQQLVGRTEFAQPTNTYDLC